MFGLSFIGKQRPPPQERQKQSKTNRLTFTNQDAINFMRRYNTVAESQIKESSNDDRKCCFTDNYLVFNLEEKMP